MTDEEEIEEYFRKCEAHRRSTEKAIARSRRNNRTVKRCAHGRAQRTRHRRCATSRMRKMTYLTWRFMNDLGFPVSAKYIRKDDGAVQTE